MQALTISFKDRPFSGPNDVAYRLSFECNGQVAETAARSRQLDMELLCNELFSL